MTTYWAPLLHIYQPPTQDPKVLRNIDNECYKPLFSLLEEFDDAKFSLNINGILFELFYEFGLSDTMDLLKNLVSENKIEIVGTAKFHPILPLIPEKEEDLLFLIKHLEKKGIIIDTNGTIVPSEHLYPYKPTKVFLKELLFHLYQ